MSDAITIDHVSKTFRIYHEREDTLRRSALRFGKRGSHEEFRALDDVSLSVPAGGTFGLLGANGSGKSTLLKVVSRILVPDSGSVTVNGRLAALLELGTGFHPELSGRENVFLNASILGLRRKDVAARFDDIVGFAELERFIDNPIKTYSSGMVVRLGFAVATSLDPEVLIIDEVLAVGDANFRGRSRERMEELLNSGCSILLVTHDMGTVRSLCSEAASLDAGRLRMHGAVSDVVDDYQEMMRERAEAAKPPEERLAAGLLARVEMLGDDGHPLDTVTAGSEMTVRVTIDSALSPGALLLTLGLTSGDGVMLSHTTVPDVFADLPERGAVTALLRVDSDALANGTYAWSVGLRDAATLDLVDRADLAIQFAVQGNNPRARGYVNLPVSFDRVASGETQTV